MQSAKRKKIESLYGGAGSQYGDVGRITQKFNIL